MPGKYALLAVIQPPTASAPARAVPKARKRRRLIVLSPIVVGSRIDCRRVTVPAHEPPHQCPRQALLRGGKGLPPLPGVRPQRHVARLLGPVAAYVVPGPHGLPRGGGLRNASQVEPDQGADPPQRGLGVCHEVLVAQAHRPPGAQPGAHPFGRQVVRHPTHDRFRVQNPPTHGRLPPRRPVPAVPRGGGPEVLLEGLPVGRHHPPAVAHQVYRVQVYAGHHREGERADRNLGTVHDGGLSARGAYSLIERARKPGVGAEPGRRPAPRLAQQARPPPLELEVVLELWVALYVVPGVYPLHPLAPHPGPERAGLLGVLDLGDVEALAAGAQRAAQPLASDPAQRLAADPTGTDQVRRLAHALDVGMVAEHHVEYGGSAAPQARYLQDLNGLFGVRHLLLTPLS